MAAIGHFVTPPQQFCAKFVLFSAVKTIQNKKINENHLDLINYLAIDAGINFYQIPSMRFVSFVLLKQLALATRYVT